MAEGVSWGGHGEQAASPCQQNVRCAGRYVLGASDPPHIFSGDNQEIRHTFASAAISTASAATRFLAATPCVHKSRRWAQGEQGVPPGYWQLLAPMKEHAPLRPRLPYTSPPPHLAACCLLAPVPKVRPGSPASARGRRELANQLRGRRRRHGVLGRRGQPP